MPVSKKGDTKPFQPKMGAHKMGENKMKGEMGGGKMGDYKMGNSAHPTKKPKA